MNDNISSFDGGDWGDILKELRKLKPEEKDEIEFLFKDYLKGESILAFWKCVAGYFGMREVTLQNIQNGFLYMYFFIIATV